MSPEPPTRSRSRRRPQAAAAAKCPPFRARPLTWIAVKARAVLHSPDDAHGRALRHRGPAHRLRLALPDLPAARVPEARRALGPGRALDAGAEPAVRQRPRPGLVRGRPLVVHVPRARRQRPGSSSGTTWRSWSACCSCWAGGPASPRSASRSTIMAFTGRDVFLTDGGDNIMGLMAIYLAFSRCGARWSLDERRRRRQAEKRQAARDRRSSAGRTRPAGRRSPSWTGRARRSSPSCTTPRCW